MGTQRGERTNPRYGQKVEGICVEKPENLKKGETLLEDFVEDGPADGGKPTRKCAYDGKQL